MSLRPLLLLVVGLALAPLLRATELTDLGEGLSYLRVQSLGESAQAVHAALADQRALVLDLRRTTASPEAAPALADSLARRAAGLLLVLVSPDTLEELAAVLEKLPRGALTLGVEGSRPTPGLVVAQPAETDRRAYAAADGGMPLDALITGRLGKERYDEAALVREFSSGIVHPARPAEPDLTNRPADQAPVLTDRVLQRAVQVHRALSALRPRAR
jgi:hypothetical protein